MTKRRVRFLLLPLLAALAVTPACTRQSAPQTAGPPAAFKLPANVRPALYPKWFDASGQIRWPPHDGCAGAETAETVPAGTLIDRFGSEGGSYFSPRGESYADRALPYICRQMTYTVYRVQKALPVKTCKAAPWFDEPGGARQFQTAQPAFKLRQDGFIAVVANDNGGSGKPSPLCGSP